MRLKQEIIDLLKSNRELRTKISLLTETHPNTVDYWVQKNSHRSPLIGYNILRFLGNELNLPMTGLVDDDEPIVNVTPIK